jgi:hypothetical protein
MKIKHLIPVLMLCGLSACATPEQLAERRRLQVEQDVETCKSYGLRPGTDAFGSCRLQLDLARHRQYDYDHSYYNYGAYSPRLGSGIYYRDR